MELLYILKHGQCLAMHARVLEAFCQLDASFMYDEEMGRTAMEIVGPRKRVPAFWLVES